MTENEAITYLGYFKNWNNDDRWLSDETMEEFVKCCVEALKEIQQYRAIGTVEECREAVEKQKPKKPEIYTDTVQTMNESFERDVFECPVCGDYICNVEDEIPRYCSSCGQALEESEEE